jgi:hypothetical protein
MTEAAPPGGRLAGPESGALFFRRLGRWSGHRASRSQTALRGRSPRREIFLALILPANCTRRSQEGATKLTDQYGEGRQRVPAWKSYSKPGPHPPRRGQPTGAAGDQQRSPATRGTANSPTIVPASASRYYSSGNQSRLKTRDGSSSPGPTRHPPSRPAAAPSSSARPAILGPVNQFYCGHQSPMSYAQSPPATTTRGLRSTD